MTYFLDVFAKSELLLSNLTSNGEPLAWSNQLGLGYLKSNGMEYGDEYWENYLSYGQGPLNDLINGARMSFVGSHDHGVGYSICDVGIGNGTFVASMPNCVGTDVNPNAIAWLRETNLLADPDYVYDVQTFWDVLEHVDEPAELLKSKRVFVSLPIHANMAACLASKHLKPNEHIWHFTRRGFIGFMDWHGYKLLDWNDDETKAGRESIESFFFVKQEKKKCKNCTSCKNCR